MGHAIMSGPPLATIYFGNSTHSFTPSSGVVTVGTLYPVNGHPTTDTTLSTTNTFQFAGANGASCMIMWKASTGGYGGSWILTQVGCP